MVTFYSSLHACERKKTEPLDRKTITAFNNVFGDNDYAFSTVFEFKT